MKSYSQYGEDLRFVPLLPKTGRVLEIGAYHSTQFSNSRALIEQGWAAVLIDVSPWAIINLLDNYGNASNVTILQAAVANNGLALQQILMTPDAVSSADKDVQETWKKDGGYLGFVQVATLTLEQIAMQFGGFDCISIDVEGPSVDLAIHALNLGWRPRILIVEHDTQIVQLMAVATPAGYSAIEINSTNIVLCR